MCIRDRLESFGVRAQAGDVVRGPSVTRYEFRLEQGVKLNKVTSLSDDLALALGVGNIRIAPIQMCIRDRSVDMNHAFFASRYDRGTPDYINCPLSEE